MKAAREIVALLEREGLTARVEGVLPLVYDHLRAIGEADEKSLAFYTGVDADQVASLVNCTIVCSEGLPRENPQITYIVVDEPKLAFYVLAQQFNPAPQDPGVHPSAVVHPNAKVHPTATIGPFCVLGECEVGPHVALLSHVWINDRSRICEGVVVEPHTSIGATGQVWAWGYDGRRWDLPQVGGTVIGAGGFIAAGVTIVRGALQDTRIGEMAHVAPGVRIGHNCQIGDGTFVSNGVTIPGSVTIGDNCFVGSGSSFRAGVRIGNNNIVGTGAVVTSTFDVEHAVIIGVPATVRKRIKAGEPLAGVPVRRTENRGGKKR